eukprot:4885562-Amphidinium_carterae.1
MLALARAVVDRPKRAMRSHPFDISTSEKTLTVKSPTERWCCNIFIRSRRSSKHAFTGLPCRMKNSWLHVQDLQQFIASPEAAFAFIALVGLAQAPRCCPSNHSRGWHLEQPATAGRVRPRKCLNKRAAQALPQRVAGETAVAGSEEDSAFRCFVP